MKESDVAKFPVSKLTEIIEQKEAENIEIREGMTIQEVESLLGKPLKSTVIGNTVKY